MVKLHLKKGDENLFLFETTVQIPVDELLPAILGIYNGRLKVHRVAAEIEELADHGTSLPPNMQGLTDEQLTDLKLVDEWGQKCVPSGGAVQRPDDMARRNGQAPNEKMVEMLKKTVTEAKEMVSKKKIEANEFMTLAKVQEALDILRGAVMIVYPMGLPPHDPIRLEFENTEDLTGTQASLEVIDADSGALWFSGKELLRGKKLMDYVGKNEKTKVIVKLSKKGQGAPSRERVISEEDQKAMMAFYYRKQEEMKKLDAADDDSHLDTAWADNQSLKRSFQGLQDIKWAPGKR